MDVAARIERLRGALDDAGVDAVVVSELTNVRYLTGFTGSSAMVLVAPDRVLFVTDGRYTTQSEQQLSDSGVVAEIEISTAAPELTIAGAASGIDRLGLEADSISWSAQRRWADELFDGDLVPTVGLVEDLRLVKDPGEAARIRAACAIADEALGSVRDRLADRPTERDFALELEAAMMRLGADDLSFETIVAAGPNGARPHHSPSGRQVAEGDLVVIDFGALLDGYHSDMTRAVAVGDVGDERRRMLDVVAESQRAGVEAVAAGVEAVEVDRVCRDVIEDAGWGDAFLHGTGHGVGLDIHEEPRVSSRSTATLEVGHVVTVEPGVYLPDLGGVRIEDTVLVTEGGCERLTLAPKDPQLG
ncbi:MAG: aminopeptidase P family protein [Actinomycetia bacterium]|nr:aminopeptidase P family protein [Actinomycetes bacterium]